jgi:hypothetical protein
MLMTTGQTHVAADQPGGEPGRAIAVDPALYDRYAGRYQLARASSRQ